MTARSSLLRRSIPGARPARRTSSVVAALAALAPRLVRLAHHDCADRLLALALVALALAGTARAAAADPPRPPRELRLLVVLAGFPDRPLSSFGVLCHEFGHLLGLPELYAPGGHAQEGIGVWGLMGQGTWLGRGERPPHLCAWSKLRLGWVEVETIARSTRGVTLPQVEREPRVVKIPAAPAHPEEYYLLENRARVGADRRLPGEGLLVWHVDERALAFRSAETDVERKLLGLV